MMYEGIFLTTLLTKHINTFLSLFLSLSLSLSLSLPLSLSFQSESIMSFLKYRYQNAVHLYKKTMYIANGNVTGEIRYVKESISFLISWTQLCIRYYKILCDIKMVDYFRPYLLHGDANLSEHRTLISQIMIYNSTKNWKIIYKLTSLLKTFTIYMYFNRRSIKTLT